MKVLHITSWYPNKQNANEALWIKRHIDALQSHCDNEVWHIRTVEKSKLSKTKYQSHGATHKIIGLPTSRWFLIELCAFFQLLSFAIFHKKAIRKADIVNFHIAYPSLVYWKILRPFFKKKKIVITEHWSAYHFNFGVKKELPRIQKIFKQNIPVITVSEALRSDIEAFSKETISPRIIPNIVDTSVFNYQEKEIDTPRFFMVSQWSYPKDPMSVVKVFKNTLTQNPLAKLIIGGYGNLVQEIETFILQEGLSNNVELLGVLSSEQIADEMNKASALIHLSEYETFSVVCAEAICCGCPVIASNVGGITEFINEGNGVLLEDKSNVLRAMKDLSVREFNREGIALNARQLFSPEVVGKKYYEELKKVIGDA